VSLRRDTRGSAIVTVVFAIFLAVMLGTVAVSTTVATLKTTQKNERIKRAQQGAESAIEAAIFGLNRLDLIGALNINPLNVSAITQQTCLVSLGNGALDLVNLGVGQTWCPTQTETTGGGTTYSYRISQLTRVATGACGPTGALTLDRKIVAIGVNGDVTRRISATLRAPVSLLSGAAVQSASTTTAMTMAGTARVTGNVHANAAITGLGGAPVITGTATAGFGQNVTGMVPLLGSGVGCQYFNLPGVDQGTARTANDNGTQTSPGWTVKCADNNLVDLNCKPLLLPSTGGADWDASARTLRVWGNAKVTLTGSTYSFCRLRVEGEAILVVPSTTPAARIFLDDPAACPGVTGPGQITVDSQARIMNCHASTQPGSLQLYAIGSATTATTHTFASSALLSNGAISNVCGGGLNGLVGTTATIYAPRSRIDLSGTTTIWGTVAANVVNMSGASSVNSVSSVVNLNELGTRPVLPLYRPTSYVSCSAAGFADLPNTDPSQGC
jgi:hypothetical protein